jgi:two-component system, LytTR family, sensor kinase
MATAANQQDPPSSPWPGRLRRGAIYLAVWTIVGLFFFSQDLSRARYWGDPTPWWRFLLSWMSSTTLFAALTPPMLWMGRRYPLDERGWVRRLPIHLLASVAVALLHVAVASYSVPRTGVLGGMTPKSYRDAFFFMMVIAMHSNVLSYWTVLALQHGIRVFRRYQEREKAALRLEAQAAALSAQLSRAQLSALKAQLQPHFLFNTLNAIMVLVRQRQVELAETTIARLGDLLRFVLDDVEANEVSLRRELEYLERYLAIEQLRFADRLRTEIDAEPAVLGAALPHLGLQPLVENAVRHGIGKSASAQLVRVRACRQGDELIVTVEDDGPGPGDPGEPGSGIGLSNTRARLAQLYGDRARLTLAARPGGGAVATLSVPFHLASELPS